MTKADIATKISGILINDFQVAKDKINDEATFRGSFGLDSLDIVDFIMLLQKDFGFKSSLESYRELHSYGKLVAFVDKTVNPKG